jgi:hypothetical protein
METGTEAVPPCPWCGRVTEDVDYKSCRTGSDDLVVRVLIRADCDNPTCPGPSANGAAVRGLRAPGTGPDHRAEQAS